MTLLNKINRSFNNLLSPLHSLDIEERGRMKLFIIFLFLMIIGLSTFGAYQLKKGFYSYGVVDYLLVLILIIFILLLRYLKNGKPVYRIATMLLAVILFYWVSTGAAQGYASIWVIIFPLFSFFLLGKKEGFIWTILCAGMVIILFINPYSYFTDFEYPLLYVTRHLFLLVMVILFTYNYESVRAKYKAAMEAEIKIREQTESELRRHRDHLEEIVAERTIEVQKNSEKLATSEKLYRLMSDNVNDLIWVTDLNLKFSFISPSVYRIYGYTVEEAMNLPPEKWNTPDSFSRMIKAYVKELELIKTNPEKHIILQLDQIKKDGTVFPTELKVSSIIDENGKAVGIVGITRDISERVAIEQEREKIKEQLAQSQKMEALGTLVGGLAHDFNNFLAGIIGSFEILSFTLKKEKLKNKDYIEKYLNLGMESSKRSAGLINQLLILSKRHEIKLSPLDINNSLNHVYELCSSSFPKSVELDFRTEETPLIIMGDMLQIEQVLLNLCINASHAMTFMRSPEEKQGGTLTVKAEKVKSDYIMKENYPDEAGNVDHWIRIKISDTGVGFDNDIKQRIFEPFFSTKNKKDSTGLGLAISYNIIKKHGGIVNAYSEPGSGSCFSIYFPVYNDNKKLSPEDNDEHIIQGTGTILVIDDESTILNIAEGFLKECGYNVIIAEGADKGIEIYQNRFSGISAVLIDLSMPGKSGIEVFKKLREINSDVKAIISSGMLDNEIKEIAMEMGVKETANKPYMAAELSRKINAVITGIK